MPFFSQPPSCPYCSTTLESIPTRKKKCPHCGQLIYVRKGKLVTEDDAKITDMLDRLSGFSVTRKDFDNQRNKLSKRFGFIASVNDTFWGILNELILKVHDAQSQRNVYYEMARLVSEEGKDPKPYLSSALRIDLEELKKVGAKNVRIVGVGMRGDDPSSCGKCRELYGKRFDIDTAIQTLPIPTLCESEGGWCRCSYVSEQEWKSMRK